MSLKKKTKMKIDINIVNNIAIKAGLKILEVYNSDNFDVEIKGDNSPLTKADKLANEVIIKGLKENFPDIPIITEEEKTLPYEIRKQWKKCFLVDPLDGTKEFIKCNGEFTVNIALIEDHKVTEGVIYVPVLEQLYYTENGKAFLSEKGGQAEEINVNTFKLSDSKLRMVCSRSHMSDEVKEYLQGFDSPETVSMGSSLKFMLLANNKADIYPRLAPTMEWDTGAAQAILEAAGGSVIDQGTGESMKYNRENLLNNYFIAFGDKS